MGPLTREKGLKTEENTLLNAGDFEVTMDMGKLVDDGKEGVRFDGAVSLNDLYSNFTIQQSIFEPYMTLTIQINESKLIFEQFGSKGLQGEEFVKIKFNTPTMHIIEDLFYVTGYSPIKKSPHDLSTSLVLKCVSKEKLINDAVTVNQSFTGTTSEVASNIYKNYLLGNAKFKHLKAAKEWKEKPIIVDESIGTQKFIIPGLSPFSSLHFLALRSFGGSNFPGSFYSFYEAVDGFYFKNIENWAEDEERDAYTFDSDINDLPHHHRDFFKNIKNMSPLSMKNTMTGIQNGEFASKVTTIDFNKKSFTLTEFNMMDQRKEFNTLGKEFNMSSKFFDMFGSDPVETSIVIILQKKNLMKNLLLWKLKKELTCKC